MLQTEVVEKIETHILCPVTFFLSRAVCDMWKNIVQRGRSRMKIWLMGTACWIPEATNTHSVCVILIAFSMRQWLREGASTLRYMSFNIRLPLQVFGVDKGL